MKLKIFGVILIALLLSGCVTRKAPMSKQVQQTLGRADALLIMPQSNIDITVTDSNPSGQGGLIGIMTMAAVDSIRRTMEEDDASPVIKSLQKYDFRKVVLSKTNSSFAKLKKVKVKLPVKLDKIGTELSSRVFYDNSKANAVLLCRVRYELQSGSLIASLDARMYPKSKALMALVRKPNRAKPLDPSNSIYFNHFTFKKSGMTFNNIEASLNEAASNLTQQLTMDMDHGI